MDNYTMEQFYGEQVKVRLFVHDIEVPEHSRPVELVRTVKLLPTDVLSGHLMEDFAAGEVYHVLDTNSIYFDPNFTDFEIVGTVEGSDGLELYCDFYAAFDPDEVIEMLGNAGWNSEPVVEV